MSYNRQRQLNHQGFTLVELVVVLVLMGILMSITAAGLIAFQDSSQEMQINENASTIFYAAQSKLTQMESNGEIEGLRERLKYEDGNYSVSDYVPVFSPINDDFDRWYSNYITKTVMTSTSLSEEGQSRLAGTQAMLMTDLDIWGTYDKNVLISLRAKAGDYDKYVNDPNAVPVQTQILFELIEETIADHAVLNGAICIEIAPEEGQVFSAFYSSTADEFYYGNKESGSTGRVDIAQRHDGARSNKGIGYYGVTSLTHVTYLPTAGISLGELTVNNGDVLSYHLSVDDTTNLVLNDLDYTITVYDSATSRKALEFTVKGSDLKDKNTDIMENMVNCPLTRYDATGAATNMGTYRIPVYKERQNGETADGIGFILDAADASATTELLEDEAYAIRNGASPNGIFAKSLSFFRFGTWTEIEGSWTDTIYVTITVIHEDLDEPAVARSKSTSPMFADASLENKIGQGSSGDTNYKKYGIENCRHFYNMRYYEDVEITTLGQPDASASLLNKFRLTFELRNDLDWAAFAQESFYASSSKYFSDKIVAHKASGFDFPSFKMLRSTDSLIGLKQDKAEQAAEQIAAKYPTYGITDADTLVTALRNNWSVIDPADVDKKKTIRIPDILQDNLQLSYKISNLTISMQGNYVYGLYRDYEAERDKPTGLFLENMGDISFFAIDQSTITGKNKVGAICGANSGELLYVGTLSTRTTEHPEPTVVQGIQYVGGVFGYQAGIGTKDYTLAHRDLYISYLTNHARVLGTAYVGGITSSVMNGEKTRINDTGTDTKDYTNLRHITIRYCENYGQVRGVYAPLASGETIDENDEAAVLAHEKSVRYIGGIVGYMSNTVNWSSDYRYNSNRITGCYSCPVYDAVYDKDILKLLSALDDKKHYELADAEQEKLLKLLQEYNVGYCVGGIAGYANQIIIDSSGSRVSGDKLVDGYNHELKNTYIFGNQYVGGVIGFNDSYAIGSCYNAVTVIGNQYVGGIMGMNAHAKTQETEDDRKELIEPDTEYAKNNHARANGMINWGNIYGLYDYVGGVAGYNAGNIENCRSEKFGEQIPVVSGRNYVGGLVGRSMEGAVYGGATVTASVDGENYIGGLVGYIGPADSCPKSGTLFSAGSVYANGSFAGGVAGVVMNPDIYNNNYNPKPLSVTGRYYVGGIFGGSVISPSKNLNVNMWVGTENVTELDIHATAFAGGSIGYNIMGNQSAAELEACVARLAATDTMAKALVVSATGRNQAEVVQLVWNMENAKAFGICDFSMQIKPSHNSHCIMLNSITPIEKQGYESGLVYAAGVVGYNGDNTILNLVNMNNSGKFKTNLIRTTAIAVTMDVYNMDTHQIETAVVQCAFTGSMVGCNTVRSSIENCGSYSVFSTTAQYRGGLCEVNKGTILAPNLQGYPSYTPYQTVDADVDYIGGICGRNEGTITLTASQKVERTRLTGRDVVGMVCAENYGVIDTKKLNDMQVNGRSYIGGVAGRNYGTIKLGDYVQGVQANGADDGYGAGMITAYNSGTIQNTTGGELVFRGSGCVYSGDAAGGLIGEQYGSITLTDINVSVQIYPGPSKIRAISGAAGGFIGKIQAADGDVILDDCNFVTTDRTCIVSGLRAGGIVGEAVLYGDHQIVIRNCAVTNELQNATNEDTLGGIANCVKTADDMVTGYMIISNCYVATLVQNKADRLKAAGIIYDAAGRTKLDACRVYTPEVGYGITATSAYSITNCFDGSRRGIAQFGTVGTDAQVNMSNNYCMTGKTAALVTNTDYPADIKTAFAGEPLALNYYTANDQHAFYITYSETDAGTGAVTELMLDTGMRIQTAQLADLNSIDRFYGRYSNKSNGVTLWKAIDDQYMSYLSTHAVDSGL